MKVEPIEEMICEIEVGWSEANPFKVNKARNLEASEFEEDCNEEIIGESSTELMISES